MVTRWAVEKAVKASTLEPPGRHLILVLLTWSDAHTARIPARFTPSLTTLQDATGYARSTVATWLNKLEEFGWVIRDRPTVADARRRKVRTQYRLVIPAGAALDLADDPPLAAGPAPAARGRRGAGRAWRRRTTRAAVAGRATVDRAPQRRQALTGPVAGPADAQAVTAGPPGGPVWAPGSAGVGVPQPRHPSDHRYIEGPNGACAVLGCRRSAALHGAPRRQLYGTPQ